MSNIFSFVSKSIIHLLISTLPPLLYLVYNFQKQQKPKQIKKSLFVYMFTKHFTGPDTTAITVAGGLYGAATSMLHFGAVAVVDNRVTVNPDMNSKEIGHAQGLYANSPLDGKSVHMAFSEVFTWGKFSGNTLEIDGADVFGVDISSREYSSTVSAFRGLVISGLIIKGYCIYIMTTELILASLASLHETCSVLV